MSGFRLLPQAEFELDEIWFYVARQTSSVDTADRFIQTILDCLWLLGQHPEIGRRRDHDLRSGLRSFPAGEYVIIYRVERQHVVVLHILRGSRDIAALLE